MTPSILISSSPNGQWAWSTVIFTTLNEWQFQDPANLTGNPCVTWGDGFTDCGVGGSSALDLQFKLLGEIASPLELDPITPGVKRNVNSMSAIGAIPEGQVAFVWGFQTGIKPVQLLGFVTADGDGAAEIMFYIPALGDISLIYTQAIDIDTCAVSDVIENIVLND